MKRITYRQALQVHKLKHQSHVNHPLHIRIFKCCLDFIAFKRFG